MHLPNGYLNDPTCAVTTAAAIAALGVGAARLRQAGSLRSPATMAVTGAGIFAAQMVNYQVDHGTSGHMLGAALAAVVLGPWAGMLTMAVVLTAQCALFGDGGWSVLGANIINMAVVGTLSASVLYQGSLRLFGANRGRFVGVAVAGFGSVLASAGLCSLELAASGTYAFAEVLPAMLGVHLTIGVAEALMSVAIVAAVAAGSASLSGRQLAACGLAIAVAVAMFVAPLSATSPDGLERVAHDLDFAQLAASSWSFTPDYAAPGVAWQPLAVALAGVLGVLAVFATTYTAGRMTTAKAAKHPQAGERQGR
jgi:cobalt/nickel transport system permease protein